MLLISSLILQVLPYFEIIKAYYWKFFYFFSALSGEIIVATYFFSLGINIISIISLSTLVGIGFSSPLLFSVKKELRSKIFNIYLILIAIDVFFIIFSSISYLIPSAEDYQVLIEYLIIINIFGADKRLLWGLFFRMNQPVNPQIGTIAPTVFFSLGVISLILYPLFMKNDKFKSYKNVYFGFALSMFVGFAYWMVLAQQFSELEIVLHELVPIVLPILVSYIKILKDKEAENVKFLKIRFCFLIILIICSIFLFFDILGIFFYNIFNFTFF